MESQFLVQVYADGRIRISRTDDNPEYILLDALAALRLLRILEQYKQYLIQRIVHKLGD